MSPNRSDHRVLVIAADAMLAALVGTLVETTGLKVGFPAEGERADFALARIGPLTAVLVEAEADVAASDVFLQRARKRRVPVILFGRPASLEALGSWVRDSGVIAFALPAQLEALISTLERMPEAARGVERRARAERSADGQLLFVDETGRRWSVYDRRINDREHPVHRRFVNEAGETLGCDLAPGEEKAESAEALLDQLSHARPEQG